MLSSQSTRNFNPDVALRARLKELSYESEHFDPNFDSNEGPLKVDDLLNEVLAELEAIPPSLRPLDIAIGIPSIPSGSTPESTDPHGPIIHVSLSPEVKQRRAKIFRNLKDIDKEAAVTLSIGPATVSVCDKSIQVPFEKCETTLDDAVSQENTSEGEKKFFLDTELYESVRDTDAFRSFVDRTSKIVEKVLGEASVFDVFADYTGITADEKDDNSLSGFKLFKQKTYGDNKTKGRTATSIQFSPFYNELFLVSYGEPENLSDSNPDGCVLVWNLAMTNQPEFIFTVPSAVCSAVFDKFRRNLIIGGTYTGSLVLWDNRAGVKPIQRTPINSKVHSHPVYCMEMVGTQNAHDLITMDNDGKLCLWSLSMMVNPSESITLRRSNKDCSVSSMAISEGETSIVYGGTEDGSIFQANIHGSRVGVVRTYEKHTAPVTSLHFHPYSSPILTSAPQTDFSGLMLSASLDWSVKLWSPRTSPEPLWSFDHADDYIYDVKWHPIHPSVMVYSTGDSHLDLWNITVDRDAPVFSATTDSVNKLSWSTDGKRLLSGDLNGTVNLWTASQNVVQPRVEEFAKFEEVLESLKPDTVDPSLQRDAFSSS